MKYALASMIFIVTLLWTSLTVAATPAQCQAAWHKAPVSKYYEAQRWFISKRTRKGACMAAIKTKTTFGNQKNYLCYVIYVDLSNMNRLSKRKRSMRIKYDKKGAKGILYKQRRLRCSDYKNTWLPTSDD